MATTFLNLNLPVVSVTTGPDWATQVNAAFDVIDLHDHSSGKGVQIPTSGLNINADLDFNSNKSINLISNKFISNDATLTGSTNANSIYSKDGDLYWTNASGTAVQVTTGGAVVTSPGALQTVEVQSVTTNPTIGPSDTFVYLTVDTSASRTITLPLSSAVSSGRVYIIKDITGSANANPITLQRQGSDTIDGDATFTLDSDYGTWWVVGNGASEWHVS